MRGVKYYGPHLNIIPCPLPSCGARRLPPAAIIVCAPQLKSGQVEHSTNPNPNPNPRLVRGGLLRSWSASSVKGFAGVPAVSLFSETGSPSLWWSRFDGPGFQSFVGFLRNGIAFFGLSSSAFDAVFFVDFEYSPSSSSSLTTLNRFCRSRPSTSNAIEYFFPYAWRSDTDSWWKSCLVSVWVRMGSAGSQRGPTSGEFATQLVLNGIHYTTVCIRPEVHYSVGARESYQRHIVQHIMTNPNLKKFGTGCRSCCSW
jgi:hypothetical protein